MTVSISMFFMGEHTYIYESHRYISYMKGNVITYG